ncbi:hypothetical protein BDP81DRAFT_83009 [Colletotrichum phormii]|uniref:Uncharacterized protein n=1 Tax=Colletotrichum phormii TaxID=359342 RepID=A0AAJ0A0X0_9PEZI|nr:uncharacterized protein BDP81DRAFT_83009 [Colletotrichum phormii]KAK1654414.1 hypothetical protein BDP81DRAFT_83009 [Colletotrichum phormii]
MIPPSSRRCKTKRNIKCHGTTARPDFRTSGPFSVHNRVMEIQWLPGFQFRVPRGRLNEVARPPSSTASKPRGVQPTGPLCHSLWRAVCIILSASHSKCNNNNNNNHPRPRPSGFSKPGAQTLAV